MTRPLPAAREAFVLPALFLTVAGAGGLRISPVGGGLSFVPPPLITLVLAVRPFQVNPPSQFLNTPGGVSPIRALEPSIKIRAIIS